MMVGRMIFAFFSIYVDWMGVVMYVCSITSNKGSLKWFSLSSVSDSCSWLDSSWLTKNHGRGHMP